MKFWFRDDFLRFKPARSALPVLIMALCLLTGGCATSRYQAAQNLMEAGKYDQAITELRAEIEKEPANPKLWQQLGVAYFNLNNHDEAERAFQKANELDPQDGTSILYRGMIHETRQQYDTAKDLYASALNFTSNDELKRQLRYRLRWIEDRELNRLVSEAVANENKIEVAAVAKNSVAVIRFDATSISPELAPLGRGIAELIYHDLSYVEGLQLVERLELSRLQQELKLGNSEFSDKLNSPRIGKIAGASKIVSGKLTEAENKAISIDCGIIDIGPGLAEYPQPQQGKLTDVFQLQKKLTFSIIEKLGYEITPFLRNQIDSVPTESYLALIAYSRGLEYSDQGRFALAEAEFQAALAEDPNFGLAQKSLDQVSGMSGYDGSVKPVSELVDLAQAQTQRVERTDDTRGDIIRRLQNETSTGIPREDSPFTTPQVSGGKVIVRGSFEP